jgi:aminomethyltransferase
VDADLRQTPLQEEHEALGAKLGEFAGWSMPIEYAGVLTEHRAVREAAGMFDLTHLGKIEVAGPEALDELQRVITGDLAEVPVGGAQYGMVLTEDGGIVDDLITYRVDGDRYLVVPNAANTDAVLAILSEEESAGAVVEHRPDLATIAVQGPRSLELVAQVFPAVEGLDFMTCAESSYRDVVVLVARTGYTGERGVELFVPEGVARALWRDLLERGRPVGMEPAGLGARDTLRLEMGYPLHGNDISPARTPLEAGLGWAVAFDKGEFRGREALLRQKERGIAARLRALRMTERQIPRAHYPVLDEAGEPIGETTSGTFSPTLRVGIALAYLAPADAHGPGSTVQVDVRGRRGPAEVVKPPFVDRSPR